MGVVLGSASDWPSVEPAAALLKEWGISFEVVVALAHRAPKRCRLMAGTRGPGAKSNHCRGRAAAHLAGVSRGNHPAGDWRAPAQLPFAGSGQFLSTVQMPAGVPVATMALGPSGAKNAAIFAAQILALSDPRLRRDFSATKKSWSKTWSSNGSRFRPSIAGGMISGR